VLMNRLNDLRKLGLSRTDVAVYKTLFHAGSMEVGTLAEVLKVRPQGLYRIISKLQEQGFIVRIADSPLRLQARPLEAALQHYIAYQQNVAESIAGRANTLTHGTDEMRILTGRDEIFTTFIELAAYAKKDLLTISTGENVSEAIYDVVDTAIAAGAKSYIIFQKHTRENDRWLRRWVVQGSHLRIRGGEGYHLNIIDEECAILSSSNTLKSEERTAVLIRSFALVAELRNYFFQQWQEAQPLKSL
jgi:sugar-specific transcriptional regulator TrmB